MQVIQMQGSSQGYDRSRPVLRLQVVVLICLIEDAPHTRYGDHLVRCLHSQTDLPDAHAFIGLQSDL